MPPATDADPVRSDLPTPRRRSRWAAVGSVAVCAAAFVGMQWIVAPFVPLPDVGDVTDKLAWFAQHKDEFDVVFVGSSRVCSQIAPEVFDRRVAELTGRPVRSFNLGAPSMYLPESLFVVDRVLAQRPARLRWLVLELDVPKLRVEEHAGLVRREVYWHDARGTALTCENTLASHELNRPAKLSMFCHQLALYGRRFAHVGRGQEMVASLATGGEAPPDNRVLGARLDGYTPYRGVLSTGGAKDDVRRYEAAVAALAAEQGAPPANRSAREARPKTKTGQRYPQTVGPLLRRALAREADMIQRAGVWPVFLVPPVTTGEEGFRALARDRVMPPVLVFNEPAARPELYRREVRADTMHLNESGAVLFSHELAEQFAALVER